TMIAKNCAGAIPDWRGAAPTAEDLELLAQADALVAAARAHMSAYAIHQYLAAVFDVVAKANRYFANSEPWKLAKSDPARMRLVLFTTIETLRIAAILLQPVLPEAMGKLLDLLGVDGKARDFAAADNAGRAGRFEAGGRLEVGAALPAAAPIFPRYV